MSGSVICRIDAPNFQQSVETLHRPSPHLHASQSSFHQHLLPGVLIGEGHALPADDPSHRGFSPLLIGPDIHIPVDGYLTSEY